MTVASQVKQSLASTKSMHASFQSLALTASDEDAKRIFHEVMMMTDEVIKDLAIRVGELEREEPQYKGF
ncbi:DUF1657 domain-containing protein [Cytobacillus sp. S13-E01]|uniref:DUF1657 domain-containing protein n=1 Tax=Cytobacillus sp. S13-E01 TaxID=3031326 RepID=UPI0023D8C581|nr:DUF1657 domain-containing protein [Cytobacillus sp. S13-E01]MDF0727957.1 DUF1657 domain-containing protein [Cytobacillus sp. S13-E01]